MRSLFPTDRSLAQRAAPAIVGLLLPLAASAQNVGQCDDGGDLVCNQLYELQLDNLNHTSSYDSCTTAYDYGGAEFTAWLDVPTGQDVVLWADGYDPDFFADPVDIDLFAQQGSCGDSGTCVSSISGGSPEVLEFTSDGNGHWVTVDDYWGYEGAYYLDLIVGCPTSCDPNADVTADITCSSNIPAQSTNNGTDVMDFYSCGAPYPYLPQENNELIYAFTPQATGSVTFLLYNMTADFDLYVLEDLCDPAACVGSSTDLSINNDSVTFTASAGTTYYIIVENFSGDTNGTFSLDFDNGTGGCLEDCVNGVDDDGDGDIDCDDSDCFGEPECQDVEDCNGTDDDGDGRVDEGFTDTDSDGAADCVDECDNDPNKTTAGICGCGTSDIDSDSDGTPDCNDECDSDPNKTAAGICGCGVSETDSDSDGTPDCNDECDNDPNKTEAGACGCGVADTDTDGDGTFDCDDVEICDGADNDGDGLVDDDDPDVLPSSQSTFYADTDGDGFGDPNAPILACAQPNGTATNANDCDDNFASRYPGNAEVCDGIDNDCNLAVDENTECSDDDGDGYTELGGDCNDADAAIAPTAEETCDGVDEDCDQTIDEDTKCFDDDGDGYCEGADLDGDGSPDCRGSATAGDCADGDPGVNPGATENTTNGVDDDCDGVVDILVDDADGDGYTETEGGDCEPGDATAYPGATELADGVDNDCDGTVDENTSNTDDDGDGVNELRGDCDDGDPTVNPTVQETDNGRDDDCDGAVDEGSDRTDDDGDGFSENAGDCDDADPDIFPGAEEVLNGVDDDCDGTVDEGTSDVDGDGWTTEDGDCDDEDGWAHPELGELCDGADNDCDGEIDEAACGDGFEITDEQGGCGCSASGGPPVAFWLVPMLAVVARRRR